MFAYAFEPARNCNPAGGCSALAPEDFLQLYAPTEVTKLQYVSVDY